MLPTGIPLFLLFLCSCDQQSPRVGSMSTSVSRRKTKVLESDWTAFSYLSGKAGLKTLGHAAASLVE